MTTTSHAALYRFTFPSDPDGFPLSPLIIADMTDLPNTRSGGTIEVDEDTNTIKGFATFSPSFGVGMLFIEHFKFKG